MSRHCRTGARNTRPRIGHGSEIGDAMPGYAKGVSARPLRAFWGGFDAIVYANTLRDIHDTEIEVQKRG